MLNRLFLSLSKTSAADRLVSVLERFDAPKPSRAGQAPQMLRVLTYHHVADPALTPLIYPRVTVKPEAFEQQMHFLALHYQVVSMMDVLQAARTGSQLPERAVLITFDDAYRDFAENAMPVLRRYGLPVTLFVPTAFPDHPERAFWWDKLYAAIESASSLEIIQTPVGRLTVATAAQRKESFTRLREYVKSLPHQKAVDWVNQFCIELEAPSPSSQVLSWDELRELAREGVTLGPHTRTHPMMNRITAEEVREEAAGSRQDLCDQIGDVLPIFAYPSGGYNHEVIQILQAEGFEIAFTTQRGLNDLQRADYLQLKRINIGPKTTLPLLRAQLLSWMKNFIQP